VEGNEEGGSRKKQYQQSECELERHKLVNI